MDRRIRAANSGFTLIEVVIAAAIGSCLIALLYTPFINGLIMVNRENTLMNMFRSADGIMARLSSVLQPAVLPVPPGSVTKEAASAVSFHDIASSRSQGFGDNGSDWKDVLQAGTDFLPFCTPVFFRDTESTVDSSGLPVLGVVMPNGAPAESGANYIWSNPTPEERKFVLDGNIHPALAGISPGAFGVAAASGSIDVNEPRFADRLAFPAGARGYGVIRFVPDRSGGAPALVDEASLDYDLNQDGEKEDRFARGSLRIDYANSGSGSAGEVQSLFPLSGESVLLQLNADDAGYAPLFQLVGGFGGEDGDSSPSGKNWNPDDSPGSFVLLVRLLLFDQLTQRGNVLATGTHGGRQFITRQYQSFIELRNMTIG